MFHEPYFGTLPFSIDLYYFARWLSGHTGQDVETEPQETTQDEPVCKVETSADMTRASLLVESAVSESHMF